MHPLPTIMKPKRLSVSMVCIGYGVSIVGSIGYIPPWLGPPQHIHTNLGLTNIYIQSNRRKKGAAEGAVTIAYPSWLKPSVPLPFQPHLYLARTTICYLHGHGLQI